MVRCDFCKGTLEPGTGKMFVKTDGKIMHFCSKKCEKNMFKLGRKPRTTLWTGEFRQVKEKGKA